MKNNRNLLPLFLTFLKIGAFTFGGGYAMIPLIQKEVCETKKWLTDEDILNIIAIAESTPGPIAINAATFVGYRTCGFLGAAAATFGIVLPSFLIITIIAAVLKEFAELRAVQYAFFGIRAGVLALIVKALWSMYQQCPKNVFSLCVAAAAFMFAAFSDINAIFIIIGCAAAGLIHSLMISKKAKEGQK
ncbi:MAG: chromate transporter [Oscillospiraceae bacterium]|nr:chromate transporter [Oscillospiraceae bacterium]